jgi:glycerate dehydrogenase
MRIVVLDGHTLNPGDLSWAELEKQGEVEVFPRTAPGEVAARLREADATLTNKVPITAETITSCARLKYIGVTATGYNMIDMDAARRAKITVTTVPGYGTESVAQTVFALLLEITHQAGHHSRRVAEGAWTSCPDFSFVDFPLPELSGLTMGIVGFGEIGQAVGRIAHAFRMNVIYHTRTARPFDAYPARRVELEELFREADVVSLHCPLTSETKNLISWERLRTMMPGAILINTARGGLVNEADLARALRENVIAWAGLDVLSTEPPSGDNPMLTAPHCFILPHVGWATVAARHRLMTETLANFTAYCRGKSRNVIA